MNKIDLYLEKAAENGLDVCGDYLEKVKNAGCRKDIADIAMSSQGAEFICKSVSLGCFVDPDTLDELIGPYINGKYTRELDGYKSELYYKFNGSILADKTLYCMVSSDISMKIPRYRVCEIHACGDTSIKLYGEGTARIYVYGDGVNISGNEKKYKVRTIAMK